VGLLSRITLDYARSKSNSAESAWPAFPEVEKFAASFVETTGAE
jgi:hypothetical protein